MTNRREEKSKWCGLSIPTRAPLEAFDMKRQSSAILIGLSFLAAVAGVLFWVFLGPKPIREGRCRLVRQPLDPDGSLKWMAFQLVRSSDGRPDRVKDVPAGFEQTRFYEIQSGDKSILIAADYSQKHVSLCIDRDGDGVLSEERCLTAKISEDTPVSGSRQQVGPLSLAANRSNDADITINCWRNDHIGRVLLSPRFFRTGTLRLGDQIYEVALVDGDFDGLFQTPVSLPRRGQMNRLGCDVFAIDLNHNGVFDNALYGRSEIIPLSKMVRIDKTYHAIDIAPDGKSLSLPEIKPECGMLSVEMENADVELRLYSDAADQYLRGHQWELPAGTYQAMHAALAKTDGSGDVWLSTSVFPRPSTDLGSLAHFTIEAGKTTSIKIGPPFVVKADVRIVRNNEEVQIAPIIIGCAGETYCADIPRDRRRPNRTLKIIAEDETVLVDDSFKYT